MSKELELIAHGLADAADDGCFDNPPCCDEPPCSDSCGTDLDEWQSGEEDRQFWTKLATAGVERLSEHGYSIVPTTFVDTAKSTVQSFREVECSGRLYDAPTHHWIDLLATVAGDEENGLYEPPAAAEEDQ